MKSLAIRVILAAAALACALRVEAAGYLSRRRSPSAATAPSP